jgi:hypothetical protein
MKKKAMAEMPSPFFCTVATLKLATTLVFLGVTVEEGYHTHVTPRPRHDRWLQGVSILFGAVPFAFALIRAVRTGNDLRYLWVALAAMLSAIIVMEVGTAYRRHRSTLVVLSLVAFVAATLVATAAGLVLGGRLGLGVLVVAFGCGFCSASSCALHAFMRPPVA